MAITNEQLKSLGFQQSSINEPPTLVLFEDGVIYARFWKQGDKLYCVAADQPKEKEFILLEYLSLKGLDLYITRTAQRLRSWKTNNEHIEKLLDGNHTVSGKRSIK
jgi:hypothetical protein